jgi:hypothetical protein
MLDVDKSSFLEGAMPSFRFLPPVLVALLCLSLGPEPGWSQDSAESPKSDDADRELHLERMRTLARSIVIADPAPTAGGERKPVALLEKPLLRYADSTRKTEGSALWIWTNGGRPSAILATEFYPSSPHGSAWLYEIASLSTDRIAVQKAPEIDWTAKQPGLVLQSFPAAADGTPPDAPADKPTRRLTQMRDLFRRFTAHEVEGTEGRLELRPLATPLHRYSDPATGLLDGAIFSFANGTNPEVLVLFEAQQESGGKPIWKFGFAQMTGGAIIVHLDKTEVWTRSDANPPAVREAYINGWLRSKID